jgi:uncharacterized Tic20 family protein
MSVVTPVAHFDRPVEKPQITDTEDGHVRHDSLSDGDKTYAVITHLSPMVAWIVLGPLTFFAPLVMWLVRRNSSAFVDDHGREATNFCVSFLLYHIILGITVIGLIAFPILWIIMLVNQIRAAVAASSGEYFRYPMTIRFLS